MSFSYHAHIVLLLVLGAALGNGTFQTLSADDGEAEMLQRGRKIYLNQCAACHGENGQGAQGHYEDTLEGDLEVSGLADLIAETMPEENPEACVDQDAQDVAAYIYHEFYSAAAQFRRKAPRVQLSRRTVRQYRESAADLIASFEAPLWIPEERGVEAHYFASSRWDERRRLSKQVDARIDFPNGVQHFRANGRYEGVKKIKKANKMGDGFSIFWSGGIIAPESGEYQITVHCKNGFRLYLNDPENPLIDQWVRTYGELTHHAKINLLGGRIYGFQLQLFQYQDPDVKIQLEWKPPHRNREIIPEESFVRFQVPEGLVITSAFPPDDASEGYERGVAVSQQWDEATTRAAVEAANWIKERIWKLAKTKESATDRVEKVREFCIQFVERALVTRLSTDERKFFVDQHFDNDLGIYDQVKRVVLLALKSPRFLFPSIQKRNYQFEVAARTAMVMSDGLPDQRLFHLAKEGELTDERLYGEIDRLLKDNRSRHKLREFFDVWLRASHVQSAKDQDKFPDFNEEIFLDLKRSLDLYLNEVAWAGSGDFRELFQADYLFVNPRLAKYFGYDQEPGTDPAAFAKFDLNSDYQSGVLTHPFLMAGLAYHNESSPVHRGVFVARSLLGRRLRQPPDDVEPLSEAFDPSMTTRERVEHQTKDAACMNCHSVINPLGFSLENFDAVGRFRKTEKEKPIDVAGSYMAPDGAEVQLNGPRDLANYLAQSELAQKNFIRQLFRHYTKQPVSAYGQDRLEQLYREFAKDGFNIRELIKDIVLVAVRHDLEDH